MRCPARLDSSTASAPSHLPLAARRSSPARGTRRRSKARPPAASRTVIACQSYACIVVSPGRFMEGGDDRPCRGRATRTGSGPPDPLCCHAHGRAGGVRRRRARSRAGRPCGVDRSPGDRLAGPGRACLLRSDRRLPDGGGLRQAGRGLSDPWPAPQTLDSDLEVLRTVVDHLEPGRVDLLGLSMGAPVSLAYAASTRNGSGACCCTAASPMATRSPRPRSAGP
jgi:hypothetical protein